MSHLNIAGISFVVFCIVFAVGGVVLINWYEKKKGGRW